MKKNATFDFIDEILDFDKVIEKTNRRSSNQFAEIISIETIL